MEARDSMLYDEYGSVASSYVEKSIHSQFTPRCFIAEGVGQSMCRARNGSWLKGSRGKMAGNGFKLKKKNGFWGFCIAGIELHLNKDELG